MQPEIGDGTAAGEPDRSAPLEIGECAACDGPDISAPREKGGNGRAGQECAARDRWRYGSGPPKIDDCVAANCPAISAPEEIGGSGQTGKEHAERGLAGCMAKGWLDRIGARR